MSPNARIWTRAEVADFLKIPERSVDRIRADGRLPCLRLGRRVRFIDSDVRALLTNTPRGA
jgi:excisionase family DNA binding protein